MSDSASPHRQSADIGWIAVSLLVLLASLYYGYYSRFPDIGFSLDTRWRVVAARPCPGKDCVKVGDRIESIGEVTREEFWQDRTLSFVDAFKGEDPVLIRLTRGTGTRLVEARTYRGASSLLRTESLVILFPLIFWLMGTTAVVFLRPRDQRWLMLVLFAYVTAIWFAAGLASFRRVQGSPAIFHLFIWLSLPVYVHLHTLLPSPLFGRGRRPLLIGLYAAAAAFAALDVMGTLEVFQYANYLWFLAGVVASLALLLARLLLPLDPAVKVANRIMLFGVALGFGPMMALYMLMAPLYTRLLNRTSDVDPFYAWATAIALISIPILPASYIYAIYKHYLGALEFRANRLLGVYSFFALYITVYVLALLAVSSLWAPIEGRSLAATLGISLVFVSGAPFLRGHFQSLIDRHVFGIRHTQEEVVAIVSERVPSAFDRAILAKVIVEEILPTLLVRQSALYLFQNSHFETLFELALPEDEATPTTEELRRLLQRGGRYLEPPARGWVRLAIPLQVKAETIGVWLVGRRDPDDFYPVHDVHLLSTVANQIAPVVENIRLYERAQREILQRKQAELEIRRSEERFRHLFEATLEGIALVRGGDVLEVNPALLVIFGYDEPGELIGRPLTGLVPDGDAGLTGVPREGVGRRRDGSPVDIEVAGKKYVYQGEDVTVVAMRDIARRKRDEAENRMLQQQLLHSSKMEAIGRLSAGVAHDFNNCLLAIFGYSDLLLSAYRDDPLLARTLTGIKDAGQKAAALTKQLLAFTRRQPLEARVMGVNEVVTGVEKMLRPLIGEDVALVTDLAPSLARVKIDPGQMEQVIVNMAVNSRHAMPEGGRFILRTAPLAVGPGSPAPHADVPPGSWVLLMVEDTGLGMDAETRSRVFEPFFSTKRIGEGTGLGLATAYGIVKQSGGHIFVDSEPGQGTRFSIYLPAVAEAEAAPAGAAVGPVDTGSETLLLVEDEDEVRALLRQMLVEKGYRVLQAGSADEAVAVAAGHPWVIHLLVTDVIMPRVKGTELAARLVAERPGLKVIYMSGYNEEPLLEGKGTAACLQKPFTSQDLARAVRAALDATGASAAA